MSDEMPDVRLIAISIDADSDDLSPKVDIEGFGDYEALGVLVAVVMQKAIELGDSFPFSAELEDDDED